MEMRYERNVPALSEAESESLWNKRVCVIGCGGLGGYVIESMARIGVGTITVVDYDVFSESNLNRQLFSSEHNLGKYKVEAAKERIAKVNSNVAVHTVIQPFCEENASDILGDHHVVVDALDNIPARLILQKYCNIKKIPLVHGSIGGWYGQVTTVLPGDDSLSILYGGFTRDRSVPALGNLGFIAATTASIQCAEVIKLLVKKGDILSKKVWRIDLLNNEFFIFNIT